MNMKPVELQIAVPRTSEAGRVQHDQQHRPLLDQNLLSQQAVKTGKRTASGPLKWTRATAIRM